MTEIKLYHLISNPMTAEQAAGYKPTPESISSKYTPLGNQSGGYYFFTTRDGVDNHAKFIQETSGLTTNSDTNIYIVMAEANIKDIKYPIWQLDYEATRDYFFDLFLARATISPIEFDDVIISANDKTLVIQNGKKLTKLREFKSEHSGLIERIVKHLYTKEKSFQSKYNEFLYKVITGAGDATTHFAIKTTQCPTLVSCEKVENTIEPVRSSQIDKWRARYQRS